MGGEAHFWPASAPDISWLCAEPLEMEIHSFTHSLIHSTFPKCQLCAGMGHVAVNETGEALRS